MRKMSIFISQKSRSKIHFVKNLIFMLITYPKSYILFTACNAAH